MGWSRSSGRETPRVEGSAGLFSAGFRGHVCGIHLRQVHIDSHEALGVLNTLFEILAPSSLRPVDMLLRSMFVTPDTLVSTRLLVAFWVPHLVRLGIVCRAGGGDFACFMGPQAALRPLVRAAL